MLDQYDGDVGLFLTLDGGNIDYRNGQPLMDPGGLENAVNISLFTRQGWPGNALDPNNNDKQIGSRFEEAITAQPITAQKLRDVSQAADDALKWLVNIGAATDVEVSTVSPRLNIVNIDIVITREDGETINLFYQLNWVAGFLRPVTDRVI